MNKPKKTDYKKVLVRNTEKPVPKAKLLSDESKQSKTESRISNKSTPKSQESSKISSEDNKTRFDCPELYSTMKLSKKIDEIVKPRKTKSLSDVDKSNKALAVDEKVTRKVNFPYDQQIYRDLIPLINGETKSQEITCSRNPLPKKDKEPILSDFLEERGKENYFYMPQVKIECEPVIKCNDTLRLYRILEKDAKED